MAQESQQQGENTPARRTLLVGAGLAGVAGLAAACGGGGDDAAGGSGGDAGGQTGGSGGAGGGSLATTAEIPVGGGKIFEDAKVVVCQPSQGEFTAFSAECTHKGCSVGSVSGGAIVCPCHNSRFSIADGSVMQPPAEDPLEKRPINVQGEQITLA